LGTNHFGTAFARPAGEGRNAPRGAGKGVPHAGAILADPAVPGSRRRCRRRAAGVRHRARPPVRPKGRAQGGAEKLSPYECGFEAFEDAHMQFDVRYYLIAILFIAFDLEIAFVFPWAVIFRSLGVVGLVEMGIFLGLLVLGFVYAWKKGALEWE
jgi:NADH-quinone oxidoreductase subunit A